MENVQERPDVIEARKILRDAIPKAAAVLVKLLDAEDERLRLRAASVILTTEAVTEPEDVLRFNWRMGYGKY